MKRVTATERLQRILAVLPWIVQHQGATVDQICERFGLDRKGLLEDLELVFVEVGLHPFTPDMLTEVTIEDDRVYVQDARGHLVCVDSRTNQVVWTAENGGINNSSSPAVLDDKVYIGSTAGHLAIYDARTGKLLTRVSAEGPVIAAPALANGAVYFSTMDGKLTKIDPAGKVRWTFSGGNTSLTEFAVKGSRIFFFANGGNEKCYISSADWMTRNLDYRVEVATPILDPALAAELRYYFNLQIRDSARARIIDQRQANEYHRGGRNHRAQVDIYRWLSRASARREDGGAGTGEGS